MWVSGLLDLKRGEAGNGEFTRSMDEYYRRFQTVLYNGACTAVAGSGGRAAVVWYGISCRMLCSVRI